MEQLKTFNSEEINIFIDSVLLLILKPKSLKKIFGDHMLSAVKDDENGSLFAIPTVT